MGLEIPVSLDADFSFKYNIRILSENFILNDNIYCNINFDDQCPSYGQIKGRDYGGKINEGLTKKINIFLQRNPDIAITSFVIPNFLGNTIKFKNEFLLSRPKNSEWILYYTDLAKNYNVEYAIHGYFHLQKENPFFQSNTEFAFKNQREALNCLQNSLDVFKDIGWLVTGFRQPGWDLSRSIGLPTIVKNLGIRYIAANSYNAGFNAGGIQRVSNYFPTLMDGVINFPQNIELDWPLEKALQQIDFLLNIKALISIKAHFVDKGIINCLSKENIDKLEVIINYLKKKTANKIQFVTLNQLLDMLIKPV